MVMPRRSTASSACSSAAFSGSGYADISELDKYKLVENIGKGSFGVISKVQRKEDGKEFALKQLDYSKLSDKDRRQILAEVAILESLKHRNIVQLVQKIKDPKNERIYIVMEYCTSGDLGTVIRKAQRSKQPLNEDRIWNIFLQITLALHHCHWPAERPSSTGRQSGRANSAATREESVPRYQVLHRDLKPENIFLSDEFVKLGDFGLSKDMGNSAFTSTYVGTPLYMPPEILGENRYDTKSDIWSLGCVVFEMCALSSPFSTATTQAELISMVKSGRLPPLPSNISVELTQVIRAMLTLNPAKRPSTKDLLELGEMKIHRKLFTVQNQAALIVSKREELKQYEERLKARAAQLDEKEQSLRAMEESLQARVDELTTREEESRDTKRRLNTAAEQLREHWERLREEKDNHRDSIAGGVLDLPEEPRTSRRPSLAPTRPALEERNTVSVLPTTRASRGAFSAYPAFDDTPSKIPFLSNHPAQASPSDRAPSTRSATPLRRNNTKSMGNIGTHYRESSGKYESTPARQGITNFGFRQRTSIGSPSDIRLSEDITMASPASTAFMSPAPSTFVPRSRRSSIAPSVITGTSRMPSTSSSDPSISGSGHSDQTPEGLNGVPNMPPTMIPAPVPTTFTYRETATPAKWGQEDPDLPSPFIRRMPTAPPALHHPTYNTYTTAQAGSGSGSGPTTSASSSNTSSQYPQGINERQERQPLGAINPQPGATAVAGSHLGAGAGAMGKKAGVPRSRSGTLHQQVLRSNAARTSEGAVRARISVAR